MRFERFMAAGFAAELLMLTVVVMVLAVHGLFTGTFAILLTVLGIVPVAGTLYFFRADRRRAHSRSVAHG